MAERYKHQHASYYPFHHSGTLYCYQPCPVGAPSHSHARKSCPFRVSYRFDHGSNRFDHGSNKWRVEAVHTTHDHMDATPKPALSIAPIMDASTPPSNAPVISAAASGAAPLPQPAPATTVPYAVPYIRGRCVSPSTPFAVRPSRPRFALCFVAVPSSSSLLLLSH